MTLDDISSRPGEQRPSASTLDISRRRFIQVSVAAGGGLLLSCCVAFGGSEPFVSNAFNRVDGDGQIVLTMPYVEMGQGTYTAIPMLIAEELEVSLQQIRLEHAPPNAKLYGNPLLGGVQATGGSPPYRPSLKRAPVNEKAIFVGASMANFLSLSDQEPSYAKMGNSSDVARKNSSVTGGAGIQLAQRRHPNFYSSANRRPDCLPSRVSSSNILAFSFQPKTYIGQHQFSGGRPIEPSANAFYRHRHQGIIDFPARRDDHEPRGS
jgi:hypothetical protein